MAYACCVCEQGASEVPVEHCQRNRRPFGQGCCRHSDVASGLMFTKDFSIILPCVITLSDNQCFFKMHLDFTGCQTLQ